MCGRYYIEIDNADLAEIIKTVERNTQNKSVKTGEVFPTNIAPVLSPKGILTAMKWGFPKFDSKGEIINARSETAAEKNMFRQLMIEGRCLVPASWYFEWEKRDSLKIKYSLKPAGGKPIWMAGLSRIDHKTGEQQFVIMTRTAWSGISFIHDRMPVILPQEIHDEWLNGNNPKGLISQAINEVEYYQVNA